jgi:hypothetical protein
MSIASRSVRFFGCGMGLTARGVSCGAYCVRAELKSQLKQERQERRALEQELEECKQQIAEAGLL